MILEQPPTDPGLKIVSSLGPPNYPPIRWLESQYDTDPYKAALSQKWLIIPEVIRDRLVSAVVYSGKRRLYLISTTTTNRHLAAYDLGYVPGINTSGLYFGGVWINSQNSLIHELGHCAQMVAGDLKVQPDVLALYNALQPYISSSYAYTNCNEWLAECWTCQLGEPVLLPAQTASSLLAWYGAAAGYSQEWGVAVRQLWLTHYPELPAFLGGAFDAPPAAGVPTLVDSPVLWPSTFTNPAHPPGTPLNTTFQYNILGTAKTAIFNGFPWPTFAWEINVNGGGWTALPDTGPALVSITPSPSWVTVAWRVTATNANGSVTSTTPTYSSTLSAPTFTSVSPTSGRYDQANSVVITGTGFTGTTSVQIGDTYPAWAEVASFVVDSDTQITAQTAIISAADAYAALMVKAKVINPVGEVTSTAVWSWYGPPRFSTHPNVAAQSKAVGASLFLNTSVQSSSTATYQWQRKLTGDSTWTDIAGRTSTNTVGMVLAAVDGYATGQTWQFRNTATNVYGTVYSNLSGIITIT